MHKLLIVDDSPTLRGIMMRTLLQADLPIDEIFEAGSGAAGLTQLEIHPDIRLVLCDVDMPRMDAVEFVESVVGTHGAERPVLVIVTTESRRATADAALARGADACIEKPFAPDELHATLAPYLSDSPSPVRAS
jgi:two-component system chemotaxis response regulator CheY